MSAGEDDVNPYLAPRTQGEGERRSRWRYRSSNTRLALCVTSFAVLLLLDVLEALGLIPELLDSDPRSIFWVQVAQLFLAGIEFVAAMTFFAWCDLTGCNANALSSRRMRFSPGAWLWLLVPGVNLVLPYFVVREYYTALQPSRRVPLWFPAWWLARICTQLLGFELYAPVRRALGVEGRSPGLCTIADVAGTVSFACVLLVIVTIERLHRAHAREARLRAARALS